MRVVRDTGTYRLWLAAAAIAGASGVAMGAYASHGLSFIAEPAAREAARILMQTAVLYQLLHALALLGTGIWARALGANRWLTAAGGLFVAGILLFSGLIYLRILTGMEVFRALVPWGGGCLIAAWACLGGAALRPAFRAAPGPGAA